MKRRVPLVQAGSVAQVSATHDPPVHAPPVQLVPSVTRVHAWLSVTVELPQLPLVQTGATQERVCVPASAQTLAKPPQVPQPPQLNEPQIEPSVATASAGQLALDPEQVSATSQAPVELRHSVELGA